MVGGSMSGKGGAVNTGDLPRQDVERHSAEVRVPIVAMKPGNSGGAKGDRKVEPSSEGQREATSPPVPLSTDTQGEEDLWQRHKSERGVWSEKMLMALTSGVKGTKRSAGREPKAARRVSASESNVWFSLIDKIYAPRTLGLAWEPKRSAGRQPQAARRA